MRAAAWITIGLGGAGSVALTLYVGSGGWILMALFLGWVLSPFAALALVGLSSSGWAVRMRMASRILAFVFAPVSLAIYGNVAFGPPRAQPAFAFLMVPLASWVLIGIAVGASGQGRAAPYRMRIMPARPIAAILVAAAALAQQPLKFDVASIKPNTTAERNSTWRLGADTFTGENIPVKFLMLTAFRIKESQLTGLPGWTETAKYDIVAKSENKLAQEQIYGMLRSLVTDRFQLRYHQIKKTIPVFAMVRAKGGIKVTESKDGPCPLPPPNFCGQWFSRRNQIDGTRLMMPQLADALTFNIEDRIVVDKTGYNKTFDVKLTWSPEPDPGDRNDVPEGPSLFTAVQEQLGIRLEASKAPVDVIVVDRIEKPGEN